MGPARGVGLRLPSGAAGEVTRTVGYFERDADVIAPWLVDGLDAGWGLRAVAWESFAQAAAYLAPSPLLTRYAVIPVASWTLILNNTPLGTDVGVLPSLAARQLGCRAIRATCAEDADPGYAARILEVFGPDGVAPLLAVRSIAAADDGGRWIFETYGEPFQFEQHEAYAARRKSDRFTSALLYDYLRRLGVPIDTEPAWSRTVLVERVTPKGRRAR